jgi:hypothetical protein
MSLDLNYQNSETDWVEVPHSESLNIRKELSILLWIWPDEIGNKAGLVSKGILKAPWSLRFNNSENLSFIVNQGYNLDDPEDPNYAPGAVGKGGTISTFNIAEANEVEDWVFVGVISDGQTVRLVKNGEVDEFPMSVVFAQSEDPLTLGAYLGLNATNTGTLDSYFNGLMDEVRIYNRALSNREVLAISGIPEKAFLPEPVDGAGTLSPVELSWGSTGDTDKLYVGLDPTDLELMYEGTDGSYTLTELQPGVTYYWRVDSKSTESTVTGDLWTFTAASTTAVGPSPVEGADFVEVADGISLSWLPAFASTAYDVYLGTAADALTLLGQVTGTSYVDAAQPLVSETTYYWRVDTVTTDGVVAGPVWSFTTRPVFPVDDDLVGWYKFEFGQGSDVIDWSRSGNDGFIVGDPEWVESGFASRALSFAGENDYVQIPRVVQNDWTIMLWLRTDDLDQGGTKPKKFRNDSGLIDGDFGSQLHNFGMTFEQGHILVGATAPGTNAKNGTLISSINISDHEWHAAAWTRNATAGEMAIYLDGKLDTSDIRAEAWTGPKDAQDHIKIGKLDFTNSHGWWTGELDEVKFFTRVLDEAEIQDEMRPDKRQPSLPEPSTGTIVDRETEVTLSWRGGDGAIAHNVYVGTDPDNLVLSSSAQTGTTYEVGLLTVGSHTWQIGEIMPDTKEILGPIWRIDVSNWLILDNFESYGHTNVDNPVWETWMDGYSTGESGSTAGDVDPPYVALNNVDEGQQSMPILYDNTGFFSKAVGALHSEVYRVYEGGADFTRLGSTTLSLRFKGNNNNNLLETDVLYVAFQDTSGAVAVKSVETPEGGINPLSDNIWKDMVVGLTALTGVDLTSVERFYIGVGDRSSPTAGSFGRIVVDNILLTTD